MTLPHLPLVSESARSPRPHGLAGAASSVEYSRRRRAVGGAEPCGAEPPALLRASSHRMSPPPNCPCSRQTLARPGSRFGGRPRAEGTRMAVGCANGPRDRQRGHGGAAPTRSRRPPGWWWCGTGCGERRGRDPETRCAGVGQSALRPRRVGTAS